MVKDVFKNKTKLYKTEKESISCIWVIKLILFKYLNFLFSVSHDAQRWEGSSSRAAYQVPTSPASPATCVVCVWATAQDRTNVRKEKTCMMDTTVPSGNIPNPCTSSGIHVSLKFSPLSPSSQFKCFF